MRTLTERFLFESKRSEIRKYKNALKNPPKWFNVDNIQDSTDRKRAQHNEISEYGADSCVYDMITSYIKDSEVGNKVVNNYNRWVITALWKDNDLRNMCQAYLEEYIDDENVPFVVMCAMINDLMKTHKSKDPVIDELVKYITK